VAVAPLCFDPDQWLLAWRAIKSPLQKVAMAPIKGITTMKLLRSVLLSTAVVVLMQTPAVTDPLKDDLDAIRKEFCDGEPFKKCLAKFQAEMAFDQGRAEAALEVCPRMVVTDQPLRDFRHKKYSTSPDFAEGYKYIKTDYASGDFLKREIMCNGAAIGDSEQHPKPYQMTWLKIEWKDEDRAPLISKEDLAAKGKAFQAGYYNGNCKDPCKFNTEIFFGPEHKLYRQGEEAGRIDRYRAKRSSK
jgi:hypothetical protein